MAILLLPRFQRAARMRLSHVPILAAGALILSACGDAAGPIDPSLDPTAVLRVEVSPIVDTIFAADTIRATDQLQLSAVIIGQGGPINKGKPVWISEDPSVATVSETGLVRPLRYGTVRIAASAAKKGYATIVIAPAVKKVTITANADTVFVDDPLSARDTLRLSALLLDENGELVKGSRIVWSSAVPATASIDGTGLMRALSVGTTTILATSSGVSGASTVVVAPRVKSITLTSPVTASLALDTIQLTATAFDYADAAMPGRTFLWESSNTAVATVNGSGRVTSVGVGSVSITARDAFRSASVSFSVSERRLLAAEAGGDFSCGTTALGRLYCWGRGDVGQLATLPDSACFDETVVQIDDSTLVLQQLAIPSGCSLAPKRSSGVPRDFRRVATGGNFGCALSTERLIYCWGQDESGQIGNGSTSGGGPLPTLATVSNIRFDSLSAGGRHACALTSAGAAYCWGNDSRGQLGDRRTVNSTTPIPVFGGYAFRSLSAGGYHTCGILMNGSAMCWGANDRGQLGIGSTSTLVDQPNTVVLGGSFASISAGYAHTCAITFDDRAFCWGDNTRGQLGIGTVVDFASSPTAVAGGLVFRQVAAGGYQDTVAVLLNPRDSLGITLLSRGIRSHTCALTAAGTAYCWGDNYWRQSGLDDIAGDRILTPNPIIAGASGGFRTISAGSRHSCAYGADGEAWCWGSNVFGALGNELQAAGRSTPQRVVRPR